MSVKSHAYAPKSAIGWTHIWGEGEQLPLTDDAAVLLVNFGFIAYSPEDGPNARVYRPVGDITMDKIRSFLI